MDTEQQLAEIKALVLQTNQRLEHLEHKTDDITVQLKEIDNRFKKFDIRIDTYQKASQQLVNLAFRPIVAATAAMVIPTITNR